MKTLTSAALRSLVALVLAVPLFGILTVGSVAQTPPAHSPEGEMLVVTANLQEAWDRTDMRSQSELKNYVERLLDQAPFLPDVLLLQEVRRKSAKYVAEEMTRATGESYVMAVVPPRRPWTQNPKRRTETDSGIVMNADSTKKVGEGGFISLTYLRKHAADKVERVETTRHARALFAERTGDMRLAGASVHLQYGHLLPKHEARYQVEWTDKLAQTMTNLYPDAARTIGGDFNQDRCQGGSDVRNCDKAPFWENLTAMPWHYEDALYTAFRNGKEGVGLGGVDFIFTTGRTVDAGSDTSYDKTDPNEFYSDHRFFWALIAP